ncbi:MFS general substrate transporter [Atractiella rhizophila]|nr:MFS general substrate transporter [Atractiella rhizophila]
MASPVASTSAAPLPQPRPPYKTPVSPGSVLSPDPLPPSRIPSARPSFDLERQLELADDVRDVGDLHKFKDVKDEERKLEQVKEKYDPLTDPIYDRLSPRRKGIIIFIVAYCGLLAPLASSSFLPSIPQMSKDLNASPELINYTVAIFLVTIGIAPLGWAAWGQLYGRLPIYLASLPLCVLGSFGVALCDSVASLIVTRIIQGIGSSSVLSIGAGTIGDIYRPTERGRAMGLFYAGALLGPALAPVIAGVLTVQEGGWRHMQWLICGACALGFILVVLFLPETSHWKVRAEERRRKETKVEAGKGRKRWYAFWDIETRDGRRGFVWVNPFRPLRLLRYPNIFLISLNSSFTLFATYTILVPLTYTIGPRYNITSPAILGLFFLSSGVGNIVGSRLAGIQSDWVIRRSIKRRGGTFIPEDRLYAALLGGIILFPGSVIAYGFIVQTGTGGIPTAIILLALTGIGLMLVLTACNTYCVDVMQQNSAEVIAANNCIRYIFSAAASASILPLVKTIGVGPANAMSAGLGWLGCLMVILVLRYGRRMREWVDGTKEDAVEVMEEAREDDKEGSRRTSVTLGGEAEDEGKHDEKKSHAT